MTWEETIKSIRNKSEFAELVRDAYFDADLKNNVERFKRSEEFQETLKLIRSQNIEKGKIVDIGSGNGISSIAFALMGYDIVSIEPDPSDTIGAGAIQHLIDEYHLRDKVEVRRCFGEDTGLPSGFADLVYLRQALHHASDLGEMMRESYRLLKPGGMLLTVRDHVIFDERDKQLFLQTHPLHKYYGGENAYTEDQYKASMNAAGFKDVRVFKYYESVINYYPLTHTQLKELSRKKEHQLYQNLYNKIGILASLPFVKNLYRNRLRINNDTLLNEKSVPGRLYTFLAKKS